MSKPIFLKRYTADAHGNEREWSVRCNVFGYEVEIECVESGAECLDLDEWVRRYNVGAGQVDSLEPDALEEFGDRIMCAAEDAADARAEMRREERRGA